LHTSRGLLLALCVAATTSAAELRDPTQPPAAPVAAAEKQTPAAIRRAPSAALRLDAISIRRDGGSEQRSAVINGQRLREGEQIGGADVARITADHVQLIRNGRRIDLRLSPTLSLRRRSQP
jgi:hypothetical protein